MAREHQGYQIALIVLVMLVVILLATTFIFFKKFDEEVAKLEDLEKRVSSAQTDAANEKSEKEAYQTMIGVSLDKKAADFLADSDGGFKKDMEGYTGYPEYPELNINLPDGKTAGVTKSYKNLIPQFRLAMDSREAIIKSLSDQIKALQAANAAEKGTFDTSLVASKKAQDDLKKEIDGQKKSYEEQISTHQARVDDLQSQVNAATNGRQQDGVESRNKIDQLNKKTAELRLENRNIWLMVQKRKTETPSTADGKVILVRARQRLVLVNLGSASHLRPGQMFNVYDANETNLDPSKSKGKIEITRIKGAMQAEGRIVETYEDFIQNDQIHSQAWYPGQKTNYRLFGKLDINNDGADDAIKVRNIINSNGGRIHEKLEPTTDYVVLGQRPSDSKEDDKIREELAALLNKAKDRGIPTISLRELLDKMGYREGAPVVPLGRAANPDDFRKGSRRFRSRPKPQPGKNGAY